MPPIGSECINIASNPAVVSATPGSSMSKRLREEEQEGTSADTETPEEPSELPTPKKLRLVQRVGPEVSLTHAPPNTCTCIGSFRTLLTEGIPVQEHQHCTNTLK